MRVSVLVVVALAFLATGVLAKHVAPKLRTVASHHAEGKSTAVTESTSVGVDPVCLAECAAKAAWCVHKCHKSSASTVGLTCDEECALHAAECTALCALESAAPATPAPSVIPSDMSVVDASNIEAAFAEMAVHEQWNQFKATYGKVYESPAHEAHRFNLFKENLAIAAELHRKNPEATFGVNAVSERISQEMHFERIVQVADLIFVWSIFPPSFSSVH
jgi:hypothetical protein